MNHFKIAGVTVFRHVSRFCDSLTYCVLVDLRILQRVFQIRHNALSYDRPHQFFHQ